MDTRRPLLDAAIRSHPFWEPFLLVLATPLFWFPERFGIVAVVFTIGLLILRKLLKGYWLDQSALNLPLLLLAVSLLLGIPAVVDSTLALSKQLALVQGLLLVTALVPWRRLGKRLVPVTCLAISGAALLIVAGALVGTEWNQGKFLPFDVLSNRLPLLVQNLVRGTRQGGIHPNQVGGLLVLFFPAAALACLLVVGGLGRSGSIVILAASSLPVGLLLLLTQSRSAYLGAIVGLLLVAAWGAATLPTTRWLKVSSIAAVGGLAVLGLAATVILTVRWVGAVGAVGASGQSSDTFAARWELWERSVEMAGDYLVTGVGIGQFPVILRRLYPITIDQTDFVPHAHNLALQVLLDHGLVGALGFAALIVVAGSGLWRAYRSAIDRQHQAIVVGLGAGLAAFLVFGLTDTVAAGARGALAFWLLIGLIGAWAGAQVSKDWRCHSSKTSSSQSIAL